MSGNGSRGGGAWSRGGFKLPSRPGSSPFGHHAGSLGEHPSSHPSGSTSSSSIRGRGGRGASRIGGGGGNVLSRMGALVDEDEDEDLGASLEVSGNEPIHEETGDGDKVEARKERFFTKLPGNRFDELRKLREIEFEKARANGTVIDVDTKQDMQNAKKIKGTCTEMCPAYEREEREAKFNLKKEELLAGTDNRVDHSKAVTMYHRSAAGNEQFLPSDIRTPETLQRTLNYLFHDLLGEDLASTHYFIRDRTRAIRQEFSVQGGNEQLAIDCLERMARYHVHALHTQCRDASFSVQQECEQFRKIFTSLDQLYELVRASQTGAPSPASPHEAEFYGYTLLTHLFDPDILRKIEALPTDVFNTPEVQRALSLCYLARRSRSDSETSQNNYIKFFKMVQSSQTSYLAAVCLETHFSGVRKAALLAMRKAFLNKKMIDIKDLVDPLGCEVDDGCAEIAAVCEELGLQVNREQGIPVSVALNKSSEIVDKYPTYYQAFSRRLVDNKRAGWSHVDIIDGHALPAKARVTSISRSKPSPKLAAPTPSWSTPTLNAFSESTLSATAPAFQPRFATSGTTQPPVAPPVGPSTSVFGFSSASSHFSSFPAPAPIPSSTVFAPTPLRRAFQFQSTSSSESSSPFVSTTPGDTSRSAASQDTTVSPMPAAGAVPFAPKEVSASPLASRSDPPPSAAPSGVSPKMPSRPTIPFISSTTILELADCLIDEALLPRLQSLVSQEVSVELLAKKKRRETAIALERSKMLDSASKIITGEMVDRIASAIVERAVADEQRRRWLMQRSLERWGEHLEERLVEEERRDAYRTEVESMGVALCRSTVVRDSRVDDPEDEEMSEGEVIPETLLARRSPADFALNKAMRSIWTPSSFLSTLVNVVSDTHISALTPSTSTESEHKWDVVLSMAGNGPSRTGRWLKEKLGIVGDNMKSKSKQAGAFTLKVGTEDGLSGLDHVGLIVFEESRPPSPGDAKRLSELVERVHSRSAYRIYLIIASWSGPTSPLAWTLPEWVRRWGFVDLDVESPDEAFLGVLGNLLADGVELADIPTRPISDYVDAMTPVWQDVFSYGLDVVASDPSDWTTWSETLRQLLECLDRYSSAVCTSIGRRKLAGTLEFPPFAPSIPVMDSQCGSRALVEYLALSHFANNISFDLLRADLLSTLRSAGVPSLREFFEVLYASLSSQLRALPDDTAHTEEDLDAALYNAKRNFAEFTSGIKKKFEAVMSRRRREQETIAPSPFTMAKRQPDLTLLDLMVTPVKTVTGKRPRADEREPAVEAETWDEGEPVDHIQKLRRLVMEIRNLA